MEKSNRPVVPAKKRRLHLESQESNLEEHFPVGKKAREETNAIDRKNENIFELLPDEILMKIVGYLSTYDLLRILAPVSKKFWKISQDPFLIKSIKLRAQLEDLTEKEEEKLLSDFSDVVRRSEKLKFLSLNFIGWDERKIFQLFDHLPQSLEELWLKFDGMNGRSIDFHVLKCLETRSKLKILKIDFDQYPHSINELLVLPQLNSKTLKELDLKFNKNYPGEYGPRYGYSVLSVIFKAKRILNYIKYITKQFPKIEILRLSLWIEPKKDLEVFVRHNNQNVKFYDRVQQIAMEQNIKIKIVDLFKSSQIFPEDVDNVSGL